MEFYHYDHSPFDPEPINIQECVEAVIRHMQMRDVKFDADTFRALVARMDQDELRERIRGLEGGEHMRYNNKEWLEQDIAANVNYLMQQRNAGGM